jgi:hypothetical protein
MHRNPASIASVYMIMTMHFDQELVRPLPRRPWIDSRSIGAPVDLINCACRGMPSGHLTCLGQSWEESATAQVRVKCLHERTARIDRKEAQRKRHPRAQLRQGNRWLAESTAPRDCDPRPFPALASHFPVHAELSSPTSRFTTPLSARRRGSVRELGRSEWASRRADCPGRHSV